MPTVNGTYYAPDDPHVTNPNQPGYVGGGGGGDGGAGSGSTLQDILQLNAPGAPMPTSSVPGTDQSARTMPGYTGYEAAGQPFVSTSPSTAGMNGLFLSPPGHQAPVEHFNVDTTPPYAVYPPGTPAPTEGTQVSSSDLSPTALALSAMTMPAMETDTTGDNNDKKREFGLNEGVANGGAFIPGQQYVAQDPNGQGYDVFFNGKQQGNEYTGPNAQSAAEQAYNALVGLPNGSTTPPAATATPPATGQGKDFDPNTPLFTKDGQVRDRQKLINDYISASQGTADPAVLSRATNQELVDLSNQAWDSGEDTLAKQKQAADQAQGARNTILPDLIHIAQQEPASIPVINAILGQMGLPGMEGTAVANPNNLTWADWNAMPLDAQQMLLATFPGGPTGAAAKAFIAALQATAPTQNKTAGPPTVSYAPLA